MIALMFLGGVVLYVLLAIWIVRNTPSLAATEKWKKRIKIITLIAVLYFPVIEPLGSFLIFQAYGFSLSRATVNKTVQDVDRIYSDDRISSSRLPHVRDPKLRANKQKIRRFAFLEYYHRERNSYVEFDLIHDVPIKTISKRTARYSIDETCSTLPPFCEKRTIFIKDDSGLVLGEYVEILWFGSHLNQWLASMTAGRGHSGTFYPSMDFRDFIQTVLVPSYQSE